MKRREARKTGMKNRMHEGVYHLPARITTEGSVVGAGEATTVTAAVTTTTATTATAATSTATTPATAAATATVADHLSETGVDVLLSLGQDVNKVASLLGVW
jgi:hypothetical protein